MAFILIRKCWFHSEKEMYPQLSSFSASGSEGGGWREEEMTEALVDLTNEINFAANNDINEDTEPVDQEASTFDVMFEEQLELWPECTKMSSFKFLVKLMHLKVMDLKILKNL